MFILGVSEGQGSLVCCSPWGHKESDVTEQLNNKQSSCYGICSIHTVIVKALGNSRLGRKIKFPAIVRQAQFRPGSDLLWWPCFKCTTDQTAFSILTRSHGTPGPSMGSWWTFEQGDHQLWRKDWKPSHHTVGSFKFCLMQTLSHSTYFF